MLGFIQSSQVGEWCDVPAFGEDDAPRNADDETVLTLWKSACEDVGESASRGSVAYARAKPGGQVYLVHKDATGDLPTDREKHPVRTGILKMESSVTLSRGEAVTTIPFGFVSESDRAATLAWLEMMKSAVGKAEIVRAPRSPAPGVYAE